VPEGEADTQFPISTLAPGRYVLVNARPRLSMELGAGWRDPERDETDGFAMGWTKDASKEDAPVGGFSMGRIQVVLDGPCRESPTRAVDQSPKGLVDWLTAHPWLRTTQPLPVNVGGYSGLRVDVTRGKSPKGSCAVDPELPADLQALLAERVYLFLFADDTFWLGPDERFRLIVIDVDGAPVSFLAYSTSGFDDFMPHVDSVLASIRFEDQGD
jgi:hypothetical protein